MSEVRASTMMCSGTRIGSGCCFSTGLSRNREKTENATAVNRARQKSKLDFFSSNAASSTGIEALQIWSQRTT